MDADLFRPSLQEGLKRKVLTYDIGKLVYVSFLGGLIPTVVLGMKNAKELQVKAQLIKMLVSFAVLVFVGKALFLWTLGGGDLQLLRSTEVRWAFRGVNLLIFLGFYWIMKDRFKQLVFTGGAEIRPLLKDAVIWSLVGGVIESVVYLGGGYLIHDVIL